MALSSGVSQKTSITYQAMANSTPAVLKEIFVKNILNYWQFHEFTISIFGDQLQLFWGREIGLQMLLSVNHEEFMKMRWFSPGSNQVEAHWTFYCSPDKSQEPPEAWPPDCSLTQVM